MVLFYENAIFFTPFHMVLGLVHGVMSIDPYKLRNFAQECKETNFDLASRTTQ